MKAYFLSVICAAMICAIVGSLGEKKGTPAMVLRLISGIFLAFTVVQPIAEIKLEDISILTGEMAQDARTAANFGQDYRVDAMAAIIKQETQTYILDKASELPGHITADVTVDDSLIPRSVTITGQMSGPGRKALSDYMETELGIAKENQIWKDS